MPGKHESFPNVRDMATDRHIYIRKLGGLVVFSIAAPVVALLYLMFFPDGEPDKCVSQGLCFCEQERRALVKQPANSYSNLIFNLLAPIFAFLYFRKFKLPRKAGETYPLKENSFFELFFLYIYAGIGAGSFFFHASLSRVGGIMDVLAMNALAGFIFSRALTRFSDAPRRTFLPSFWIVFIVLSLLKIFLDRLDLELFGLILASGALLEAVNASRGNSPRALSWFLGGPALFIPALVIWYLSRRAGDPICRPDSLLQAHALWHILCALALACYFQYVTLTPSGKKTGI